LGVHVDSLMDTMETGRPLLRALRHYLRKHPSDITQCFLQANQYCLLAAPFRKSKLFFGIRSMVDQSWGEKTLNTVLGWRVKAYVGNAKKVTEYYCNQFPCPASKQITIFNGIDTDRVSTKERGMQLRQQLGIPERARVFITVANMHFPFKGHLELLAAWLEHARRNPEHHLILAGDGNMRQELESFAANAKLQDRTHFLGIRTDVMDLLKAADVYISPSWVEGFSNAIVEAKLSGLPVIATDVGGSAELLGQGESACLIPAKDTPALISAMSAKLEAPNQREILELREKVSLHKLGEHYLSLYAGSVK
jgi:glycosyltransferase involved in cell wall biosynthesis